MPVAKISIEDFTVAIDKASIVDWARLAAFIDGEGTIFIQSNKRAHCLTLIVANTSPLLIEWLTNTFPGNVYFSHSASQRFKCNKTCMSWRVFEERAEEILIRCLPYFIIKREQADLALAYRALKRQGSRTKKLTADVLQQRDEFKRRISLLNASKVSRENTEDFPKVN